MQKSTSTRHPTKAATPASAPARPTRRTSPFNSVLASSISYLTSWETSLAAKDVSQLVRYEIELAKTELKGDVRRVGLAGALAGVAAFVGCLVLVLFCIAFAYGLITLGIWTWAAFLIVAGTCVLLAAVAVGIALLKLRHLSGL